MNGSQLGKGKFFFVIKVIGKFRKLQLLYQHTQIGPEECN